MKVVYDQSDHACEHIRLGRIDTIACEERLTNPRVLESGRDERRKDHRHCRIIEIGRPIFDRNYNFSVQKLTELVKF